MMLHWQDWLVIFLVPTVAFIVGRGRRQDPANYVDYFLARGQLGYGGFFATFLGANLVFTAIFLILSLEAARRGFFVLSVPIGFLLGTILLAILYPKLKQYLDKGQTLHQVLGSTFEPSSSHAMTIRRWAAVWTIIAFVGLVGLEYWGGIILLEWTQTPLLKNITISIIFASICTGFTFAGGLRGVSKANHWLNSVTVIGTLALYFALLSSPSAPSLSVLPFVPNNTSSVVREFPGTTDNILFSIAVLVLLLPMQVCALDTWQRGVAWKRKTHVVGYLIGAALGIVAVSWFAIHTGLYARELGWQVSDPHPLKIVLEHIHLPIWLLGLVIGGFFAAILSTADELLNCCAYAWLADVRQLQRDVDSATNIRYLGSAKFYTAFFGYAAAGLALLIYYIEHKTPIRITGIFNVVAATQVVFFLPLLIALFRPTAAPRYRGIAKASMFCAFITALGAAAAGTLSGDRGQTLIDSGPLLAFGVSLIIFGISLFLQRGKARQPTEIGG